VLQKRLLLSFSLILLAALQPTRLGAAKEPGHSSQNGRQTPAAKTTDPKVGEALAIIAKERYRLRPMPSSDRFRTRVARQYIKERYPILFERMRGVAAAFGRQIEDDAWDFNGLMYTLSDRRPPRQGTDRMLGLFRILA